MHRAGLAPGSGSKAGRRGPPPGFRFFRGLSVWGVEVHVLCNILRKPYWFLAVEGLGGCPECGCPCECVVGCSCTGRSRTGGGRRINRGRGRVVPDGGRRDGRGGKRSTNTWQRNKPGPGLHTGVGSCGQTPASEGPGCSGVAYPPTPHATSIWGKIAGTARSVNLRPLQWV